MKIVSWNVNGITSRRRALIKFLNSTQPDIFCVQETKTECPLATPQYEQIWFSGERKGYAGTLVLTKREPIAITKGIGVEKFDVEGRTITLEFSDFLSLTLMCQVIIQLPLLTGGNTESNGTALFWNTSQAFLSPLF